MFVFVEPSSYLFLVTTSYKLSLVWQTDSKGLQTETNKGGGALQVGMAFVFTLTCVNAGGHCRPAIIKVKMCSSYICDLLRAY